MCSCADRNMLDPNSRCQPRKPGGIRAGGAIHQGPLGERFGRAPPSPCRSTFPTARSMRVNGPLSVISTHWNDPSARKGAARAKTARGACSSCHVAVASFSARQLWCRHVATRFDRSVGVSIGPPNTCIRLVSLTVHFSFRRCSWGRRRVCSRTAAAGCSLAASKCLRQASTETGKQRRRRSPTQPLKDLLLLQSSAVQSMQIPTPRLTHELAQAAATSSQRGSLCQRGGCTRPRTVTSSRASTLVRGTSGLLSSMGQGVSSFWAPRRIGRC